MTESAPHPPRSRRWPRLIGWLVSLAMLAVLVVVANDRWSALPVGQRLPSLAAGAFAVFAHVAANVLLALGWRRQLQIAGHEVAIGPSIAVWSSSQLARFLVPGAAFGARAALSRRLGVPATTGAITTVLELVFTLLMHPLIVLMSLPLWADIPESMRWLGAASAIPAIVLVGLVSRPQTAVRMVAGFLRRVPVIGRRVPADGALSSSRLRSRDVGGLTAIHLGNVVLRHAAFLALVASVHPLSTPQAAAVVGASALGRFVGLIAVFAPAGLGPREGMTVLAMAPVTGSAVAIVAVAATRLAEVVAEGVVWAATRTSAAKRV